MSDPEVVAQPSSNEAVIDQPKTGRLAEAAAQVRAMVRNMPAEGETAETAEVSEPAEAEQHEAAPDPTPEPAPQAESRLKPSQLREMERRQRAAERHRQEAERMYAEIKRTQQQMEADRQRMDGERQRFEQERDGLKRWEEEAKRAPLQKMAERWGMKPEELVASLADEKANALSPEIAARFNELQLRLETESKERQRIETELKKRETEARDNYEMRQREEALRHDIRMVSHEVLLKQGDDFPHFAALPDATRQHRARAMVLAASKFQQQTGDEYTYADVLEVLEDQARQEVESVFNNERLKARYATAGSQKSTGGGSVPAKTPKANRAPSAKEAAAPGEQRETTHVERRAAAAQRLRELNGRKG